MEGQKEYPECSVYAVKNTRRLMEDRHVVIPNLIHSQFKDKGDNHYSYYAVFDGHAGPDAAQFAADNLHKNLVESNFFKSGNISDAFRYAYATTDFQYTEKSLNDGIKAGCTAVTCLLENNSRLYMAWVGDSVAVLSRNGKPYFLMDPHNLERDDEKERVESMGGTVLYFDTWRVNGTLGVSRAIGDPEYKPYVSADPDIECVDLDGTEDFLIIGCDGLWDRMTPEDAIGLIYEHLQTNSHLMNVNELVNSTAEMLADKSIKDGSCDNVTTIVVFLKDVASILKSASCPVIVDNNGFVDGYGAYGNNHNNSYGNGNNNGLEYEGISTATKTIDYGLMSEEVIGSSGLEEERERKKGGDGRCEEEKEKEKEREKEMGSTLNPFADEFQPNISSNIIGSEVGNEPKKDDEESHKNEKLDKKDLWMSEFKDDGNNHHHAQHDQQDEQEDCPKKIEMFDGLVGNGLSDSENLNQQQDQQSTGNLSSSEYEDNLSSEMIIHDIDETKNDSTQQPSAPELVFIEQEQQQLQQVPTMETNSISQAETFDGNLTPNEIPSSPITTTTSTTTTTTTTATIHNDNQSEFTFDTQSTINQYITSVSDGMVSEPYHDPYFASDSVEPESIIVNRGDDVICSGPHAIDPYSGDDKDDNDDKGVEEEDALNACSGKINIEDTQSIPLESLNPFDCGNNQFNSNNNDDEFGVDISTGDQTKSSFYDDPDNSCGGLLDFSDDQVNTIVITPNASAYLTNEEKLVGEVGSDRLSGDEQLELQLSGQQMVVDEKEKESKEEEEEMRIFEAEEKTEALSSSIADKVSKLDLQEESSSSSTIVTTTETLVNQSNENEISSQGVVTAATAVGIAAVAAAAVGVGVAGGCAIVSKSSDPVKKETISQTNVSKKSTLPATKTSTLTSTSRVGSTTTASAARKPLASRPTSSIRSTSSTTTSSSTTGKLATTRQPTSTATATSTTSTSNVKKSTVGTTSTLNKRPTQTSTTTSTTSRLSSLASSRPITSTSSRATTSTSKPLTRTTTTTTSSGLASRRPLVASSTTTSVTTKAPTRSTTTSTTTATSRLGLASSRTTTATKSSTISSFSSSSSSATGKSSLLKKESTTATGTINKNVASKRASTGTMLNRPSPVASSSLTKSSSSALNRSLTNSSSSRPSTSTLSKPSTRPTLSSTTTRAPLKGVAPTRTKSSTATSTTAPTKSTTSTNKVAVPRLGAKKATTTTNENNKLESSSSPSPLSSGITGDECITNTNTTSTTSNYNIEQQEKTSCSTPVDAITSSIKREKNVNSNSLKDELEAALASPISCEDKGVIKETKDDELSGNL